MKKEFRNCSLSNCAPLADELDAPIKAYSRALSWLACAGTLRAEDIDTVKNAGFKTVIDLRTKSEDKIGEAKLFEEKNIKYTNLEITAKGITAKQLNEFMSLLDKAEKPVLVHCASSGRVGAMITLYHIKNGMAEDMAFELGRAANMPKWYEDIIKRDLKNIIKTVNSNNPITKNPKI